MLRHQEKKKDNWHHRIYTETKVEMGRAYRKNEGQQANQTLLRKATKEKEEIKRTTKQKMARRHNKEGSGKQQTEDNRRH